MLRGFIHIGKNTWGNYVSIRIEGYCENTFYGYRVADVKRAYKNHKNLTARRVHWVVIED